MKIALVCDWLTTMRGGERCLEAVCEMYPNADIFTLVHFRGNVSSTIESHKIYTSYIQRLPGNPLKFRRYLPLFINAVRRFDFSDYDAVISFSHCAAKSIAVPYGLPHICYCHTPMRYAWHMKDDYLKRCNIAKRLIVELLLAYLRRTDLKTTVGVSHFIANSRNVQDRIKKIYGRDSTVIYPPVDCSRFKTIRSEDDYYLIVSALVPYKGIDLAVRAFCRTGRRLIIVGSGPEIGYLKSIANKNIEFVENASDNVVAEYMQKCLALIFPGEEDFGIVPLEAQACGKPVIALGFGGALETVVGLNTAGSHSNSPPTGVFFWDKTPESLLEAVVFFERHRNMFNSDACRANAMKFDKPRYKEAMRNFIQNVIN